MRAILILLAALLAVPTAHGAPAEDGEALLAAGHYQKALRWFGERAEGSDTPCEYLLGMARAHIPLAAYRSALDSAQEAFRVAATPQERAAALTLAARAYLDAALFRPYELAPHLRGDPDKAFEQSRKLLRAARDESPDTALEAYYWLGYLERYLGTQENAIVLLEEFLARAPESYYAPAARRLVEMNSYDETTAGESPIHVVEHDDRMIPPKKRKAPRLSYPPKQRHEGVKGMVQVNGVITEEGALEDLVILKGVDPRLDAAILDTLEAWTFRPARLRKGRVAVSVYYTLSVQMTLGENLQWDEVELN